SEDELLALVRRLPPLDFYVPFDSHRSTWKATDDVLVGVATDVDAPTIQAYDVRGFVHTLHLDNARDGAPLVILHAAEPRPVRPAPVARGPAEVIEDRNFASARTTKSTGGSAIATLLIDDPCEPNTDYCDGGGGDGDPQPPPPG